jgi:hypothetical protein
MPADPIRIEQQPNGRYKVTVGLTTVWISEDEAREAATDPAAAARLLNRIER